MALFRFYLPVGKAENAYLLCCQGFAVVHYGFTLGRLGRGQNALNVPGIGVGNAIKIIEARRNLIRLFPFIIPTDTHPSNRNLISAST
jgi:hypothetical protein